jgi:hypothetical protein
MFYLSASLSLFFCPLEALGFTQPLTEMNARNRKKKMFLGSRAQPVHKADNLTAIGKQIV